MHKPTSRRFLLMKIYWFFMFKTPSLQSLGNITCLRNFFCVKWIIYFHLQQKLQLVKKGDYAAKTTLKHSVPAINLIIYVLRLIAKHVLFCTFDVEMNTKRCKGKKETSSMFCMPLHTFEGTVHFGELDAEKHISL